MQDCGVAWGARPFRVPLFRNPHWKLPYWKRPHWKRPRCSYCGFTSR
jgi:hypothetical protein